MLCNDHDVILPLTQRRNHDMHDIEPIKKILPKPPLRDFLPQVFLGGTDQAHVDINPVVPPYALKLPLLEYPQQFHLDDRRDFSDFVEK